MQTTLNTKLNLRWIPRYWIILPVLIGGMLLTTLTGNRELRYAGDLMSYFEKVGEGSNPAQVNHILGAPTTTLDRWLETRKELSAAGTWCFNLADKETGKGHSV